MSKNVLSAGAAVARAASTDRSFYSPLRPVLIGPRAGLHRYAVTSERALLGAYDPLTETTYDYPGRSSGSTIDLTSVKLYASTADLNYFNKYVGLNGSCQMVSGSPNRIRAANFVFKTANGTDRSSDFYDRDVTVGDIAYVRGTNGSSEVIELTTSVTGFVGEVVAASIASATSDDNNGDTQIASASIEQVDDTPVNDVVVDVNGSLYDSVADGYVTRTYTITVTQSSTGNDATTGLLRVRSSDGLDDQDDVAPAAFGDPTSIGTKGLTVTFDVDDGHSSGSEVDQDDLVVGQAWTVVVAQAFTAPTPTSGGTYTGTKTTTYIVTVTRGGNYSDDDQPRITVTSSNGYDRSGPTTVTATDTFVTIGSYGAQIKFSQTYLRKNDVYYVVATAASAGALKTLILRDSIDDSLDGIELDLRLFARRTDLELPTARTVPTETVDWAFDDDGVTVNDAIAVLDDEFTDDGDPVAIPMDSATLYVEYREWVTTGVGDVVELTDPDDIATNLGTVAADNPIAYAASLALANTAGELLAGSRTATALTTDRVLCVPIGGDPSDTDLWQAALDLIESNEDAYALVPLTSSATVQDLVATHVADRSSNTVGFYRVCWLSRPLTEVGAVVSDATTSDNEAATATIAATAGTSPTEYTTLTASANATFVTNGVAAGDVVRINFGTDVYGNDTYDEYVVASVTSETVLVLETGPDAAIGVARMIEVWRTYSKSELVTQLTDVAAGYASSRVRLVYPDVPAFGGESLAGYFLCASLAGLTGSVPSHQGLKNCGFEGFDDLTRASKFFTSARLDDLAAGGVFVCTQTPAGVVYVRNAVTTDTSEVATREEVMVRNADMLRKAVQDEWAPYVGTGNVISSLGQLLTGALAKLTARLVSANQIPELGPPVGDLRLSNVETVVGAADQVDVTVTPIGIAVPLNELHITLPVSV